MDSKILVGIVTFNRIEKLSSTLSECTARGFRDIVVVDNGSTDGTREFLQKSNNIASIFPGKNEGGSGGFNRIMRYFLRCTSCEWLLLFDDDAYPDFLCSSLATYLRDDGDSSWPAYAFRVTYPDGELCEMNRPGINVLTRNPLRHLGREFHVREDTGTLPVDFSGFVGLLLRRSTVREVGAVSKQFFIYSDDTYYTISITNKLGKILYEPKFVLIHDCRRSSRNLAKHSSFRIEKDIVNKLVLIREYSKYPWLYSLLYVARLLIRNPLIPSSIVSAFRKGIEADLTLYRNEAICQEGI